MKKTIIWVFLTAIIMLTLALLTVTFAGTTGMLICVILFLVIDPLYSFFSGVFASTNIKKFWMLPIVTAAIFLAGVWLFFDMGEPAFLVYTEIYLSLGTVAMLITALLKKKK